MGYPRQMLLMLTGIAFAFGAGEPIGLLGVASATARQAEATPTTAGLADPADCTVEPLSEAAFVALDKGTPYALDYFERGTPVAMPPFPSGAGVPADAAVVAAVEDTAKQLSACLNAGDLLRLGALLSERALAMSFAGVAQGMLDGVERSPGPLPVEYRAPTSTVRDVLVYPDGRVSAVIEADEKGQLTVFVPSGDRYLADASYPLSTSAATPTP